MAPTISIPAWVLAVPLAVALAGILVLFVLEFRRDHRRGEYGFTWGVGVVVLFAMGIAPGFVGLGLYLTVERGYPLYWLFGLIVVAVIVVGLVGYGLDVTATAEFGAALAPGR